MNIKKYYAPSSIIDRLNKNSKISIAKRKRFNFEFELFEFLKLDNTAHLICMLQVNISACYFGFVLLCQFEKTLNDFIDEFKRLDH